MTGGRDVLPARPLGLRASFYLRRGAVTVLVAALATGSAAASVWAIADAWSIRHERRIWDRGVPATGGVVHGKVQSRGFRWIIAHYDLEVSYTDADGARYRGDLDFGTMLGRIDTAAAPDVRYDRDHPDRFALSWAVDASGPRWRWVVIVGAFLAVMAVLLGWATYASVGEIVVVRRCARTGREVVVRIADETRLNDAKGRRTSKHRYTLIVAAEHGEDVRWLEQLDLARAQPLFADAGRGTAYA